MSTIGNKCKKIPSRMSKIRTLNNTRLFKGNAVYYKINSNKRWKGPCKVLAQDGQHILIKHGRNYVRCHPCHLTLSGNNENLRKTKYCYKEYKYCRQYSTSDKSLLIEWIIILPMGNKKKIRIKK